MTIRVERERSRISVLYPNVDTTKLATAWARIVPPYACRTRH
jgi:hypothetical protein